MSPALHLIAEKTNVRSALAWLERNTVDIIMVELSLSDGSALDVIRACGALHKRSEIMVIATSTDEPDIFACIDAGATSYIIRNERCDLWHDLRGAVISLHQGGSPLSHDVARKVLARARNSPRSTRPTDNKNSGILTSREAAILSLIARGKTYDEVGLELSIALGTVQNHIKSLYGKLAVHSKTKAVIEGRRLGLLSSEVA